MPRAVVVIPALNEAATIGRVVDAVRAALPEATVIVVDDGSSDATGAVARAEGAEVLRLPFNAGIGVAVQCGLRAAIVLDAEVVLRLDGDGQHDAAALPALLAAVAGGADYAIGSRFAAGAPPGFRSSFARRLGIRWFVRLLALLGMGRITDPTSGFFAAGRRAAEFLAAHYAPDYPEVDAVVRLVRYGFRVTEVPVAMRERTDGASSIGSLAAVGYMLRVTLAIVLSSLDAIARRRP